MIEQLIHRIKLRQDELKEALSVGAPINWESYQRLVGEHQGLQSTLDIIDNILEEEEGKF
jgi:hypothetical protein